MNDTRGDARISTVQDSRFSGDATLDELKLAIDNSMTGIAWLDPEGIFRQVRDGYARMLGYTPEEMVGLSWSATVPESDQPTAVDAVMKMLDEGRAVVETRAIRKDGSVFYKRLLLVKTIDAAGVHTGHYCFMSDISERQETQRRLADSERLRTIGTMAGGIAHDLNNLLTPILGAADLLEREPEALRTSTGAIRDAALRAQELIDRLLRFSRQERDDAAPLSLTSAVKTALQFVAGSLPANVALRTEFEARSDTVLGLEAPLELIVMNLVSNAGFAMREQGGKLDVSLRNPSAKEIVLEVTDTGTGISAERLDKIFDAFYTTKSPSEGTGLGLAMVKEAAAAMNATVTVDSEPGRGSSFRVAFPLCEGSPAPSEPEAERATPGLRIMVVDDEEAVLDVCRKMLEHLGHDVRCFTETGPALDEPLDEYDLVISDYRIGGESGLDFVRSLERFAGPIIMMSGHMDTPEPLPDQVTGRLNKPFLMQALQDAIHDACKVSADGR